MNPAKMSAGQGTHEVPSPALQHEGYEDPEAEHHLNLDYVYSFGKQTKPRYMDPSMFELMQWRDAENDHTFKSTKDALRDMDDYRRQKALIDRTNDGFTTESKDNFKKFVYKKLDDEHFHIPFEGTALPSHDKTVQTARPMSGQRRVLDPQQASEYYDQLSSKFNGTDYWNVMGAIMENEAQRKHLRPKSASREKQGKSGNYKRSELLDWPDGDELRRMREREKEELIAREMAIQEEQRKKKEEEEERLKQLQLADYSKVQNRLLSYKLPQRRELDPEKDKDKINRREGRIKVKFFDQEIHGAN